MSKGGKSGNEKHVVTGAQMLHKYIDNDREYHKEINSDQF